jgi:chromosome segregation ATPase
MRSIKDMMKKKPHGDGLSWDPSTSPVSGLFQPASASLDIADQARKNLLSFKSYIEQEPTDPGRVYETVAQTFSRACSTFTQHCLDLESEIENAKLQAAEAAQRELAANDVKTEVADRLEAIEAEERALQLELEGIRAETGRLESERAKSKKARSEVTEARKLHAALEETHAKLLAEYRAELDKTAELSQKVGELEVEIQREATRMAEQLAKGELRIKELAVIARAREARNGGAAQLAAVESQPEKKVQFVIEDTVKVSEEEIVRLRYMVWAIEGENEQLAKERDSLMMDFDCMNQENRGLKQIIRQLTEGN